MSAEELNSSRRRFLANVAGSTAALAAVGIGAGDLMAQGTAPSAPAAPQGGWDMSWLDKVAKAKHKQVFDAPGMADGMALTNTVVWLNGYKEVYNTNDADMAAVLVFRSKGLPVALNDDMWTRLKFGEDDKLKDPATGEPTTRNPFFSAKAGETHSPLMPNGGIDTLIARGMIVLCCNLALMRHAGALVKNEGITREKAQADLIASVIPGVIRMPSGIFATTRAEEAGCQFLRSS